MHGQSGCHWLSRGGCCCRAAQLLEGGKQVPNRSRPTRNKTKKVIGGATDEEIAEHAARPRMPRPAAVRQLQRNRSKGKNGKMRVGSKHINDAAEALLGMGSGFVDDDTLVRFLLLLSHGSGTSYLAMMCCCVLLVACIAFALTHAISGASAVLAMQYDRLGQLNASQLH